MEGKKFVLVVDEETQGYKKEFDDVSNLLEIVTSLIDERVIEIKVKRKGIAVGNPLSYTNT